MAGFELRDYQKECVEVVNALPPGAYLIHLATGLGKTVITSFFDRHKRADGTNGRLLFISHREELVRQPEKYFNASFGIEKGSEHSHGEEIVSASIQTLSNPRRLKAFKPDEFDIIIVDECHHYALSSKQWIRPLQYFKPRLLIGLTATLRGDGVRLDNVFERIVFQRDIQWGIRNGWLCGIRAIRVLTNADLSKVKLIAGDFSEGELAKALVESDTIMQTAAAYVKHCHSKSRQTLLYTVSVGLCHSVKEAICKLLPKRDHDSIQIITGHTSPKERRTILSAFANRMVRCVISVSVLTEGFDCPSADCIINMRATCNDSLFQQMVGRGLRLSPESDKKDCLVLDIVPASKVRNRRLCSALSLFGIDPDLTTKEQREQMETGYDPMQMADIINHIIDKRHKTLETIRLIEQEIDLFASEQVQAILNDDEKTVPPELSGFHVSLSPSDQERYSVAFANGKATFSEPDLLGNTHMRIYTGMSIYNKTLKISDAADILKSLITVYGGPKYLWSEDMHRSWASEPPTTNQRYWLEHHSNDLGIPKDQHFSKASASELIGLAKRIQEMKAERRARGIVFDDAKRPPRDTPEDKQKREQQVVQAYEAYQKEQEVLLERGAAGFDDFCSSVASKAKALPALSFAEPERLSPPKDYNVVYQSWKKNPQKDVPFRLEDTSHSTIPSGLSCSESQRRYLRKLIFECKQKHLDLSAFLEPPDEMAAAAVLIGLFKLLSSYMSIMSGVPHVKKFVLDVQYLEDELKRQGPYERDWTLRLTAVFDD